MKIKKALAFALALIMCISLCSLNVAAESENVTFEAIAGTSNTNDGYANLIDGDVKTIWGSHWGGNSGTNAQIIFKASEEIVTYGYTFVTAKDNETYRNRNPKSWQFFGSNDYDSENGSANWTPLHTVTDDSVLQDKNTASYTYRFENDAAYRYYKLEITENKGSDYMQLGEMILFYALPGEAGFWALDGTIGFNNENYENLFDKKTDTKWCVKKGVDPISVVIKAQVPVYVSAYTFTTANDTKGNPGRNPKSWTIYGCNDYDEQSKSGGSWTKIHSVEEYMSMPNANFESRSFSCADNIESYKYYKLEVTAVQDGDILQLSEMSFTYATCVHEWSEISQTEATCTLPAYDIQHCTKCNKEIKTQTAPAKGHKYQDGACSVCGISVPAKIGNNLYESLSDAVNAAEDGDVITLLRNSDIDNSLNILKDNVTLELNGFTITQTGSGSVIIINSGNAFTLTDSSEDKKGTVTGGSAENGGGVYVGENCTFNMTGGIISNCTAKDGGAIYANKGIVNLNGYSIIQGNRAEEYSGGAIYAKNNSIVTIGDCTISENVANGNGGGIYAYNSTVKMENGNVFLNNAVYGGGIYIHASELIMNNGNIWKNTASNFGGGVMVQIDNAKTSATINGGDISGNIAENGENGGGGIWVNGSQIYSATLTINGGRISNNIAKNGYGGGIRLQNAYAYLNLNGGSVLSNSALRGGGIYNGGKLTVTGAPHVYMNTLYSENEEKIINNIYLPKDNTVMIGSGGLHADSVTYVEPMIGVTLEQPSAANTIAQCNSDYSFGFQSDDTNYIAAYDEENKKIILAESVHIILDPQVEGVDLIDAYAAKGGKFEKPTYEPRNMGYRFLGWYKDGERYDFSQVVNEDITLKAKWAKDGEAAIEVTADSYIVSGLKEPGFAYLASYGEKGLIDVKVVSVSEDVTAKTELNTTGANRVMAFLWSYDMTPRCEKATKTLN